MLNYKGNPSCKVCHREFNQRTATRGRPTYFCSPHCRYEYHKKTVLKNYHKRTSFKGTVRMFKILNKLYDLKISELT